MIDHIKQENHEYKKIRFQILAQAPAHETNKVPGGVAHVLCSTTRCCAFDKVNNIFDSAVEELLRVW